MKNFDILQVSARASSSQLDLPLYNATVGMLFDDSGKLYTFNTVRRTLKNISSDISLGYPPSCGTEKHRETFKKYIFDSVDSRIAETYDALITLGGTGALYMVATYLNSKNYILPDLLWTNYFGIFGVDKSKVNFYREFDVESVKEAVIQALKGNGDPILVINDPAENPTGYTISEKEYEELYKFLNGISRERKINLIMDIAYNDYGEDSSRPYRFLENLSSNIAVYITFSASKSLGIYSLRTGALLFKKDAKKIEDFAALARHMYSCPPNIGAEIFCQITNDRTLHRLFQQELESSRLMLSQRGEIMIKTLDKYHFDHVPYHNGFYIALLNIKDAYALCEKLEEQNCFVIPLDKNHIRLAICSLPTDKIEPMIKLMKKVQSEI